MHKGWDSSGCRFRVRFTARVRGGSDFGMPSTAALHETRLRRTALKSRKKSRLEADFIHSLPHPGGRFNTNARPPRSRGPASGNCSTCAQGAGHGFQTEHKGGQVGSCRKLPALCKQASTW